MRLGCLAGALSCGCSTAAHLSGGPVLAPSPEQGSPGGAEVVAKVAAGSSSARTMTALELVGRGLALEEAQALSVGGGPAWFGFVGRHSLLIDANVMLGVARIRHRAWALGSFRAAMGTGLEIAHATTTSSRRVLFGGEPMPGMAEIWQRRTLLTLDIGPSLDVSDALSPVFSVGVRLGIAWVNQRYTVTLVEKRLAPF